MRARQVVAVVTACLSIWLLAVLVMETGDGAGETVVPAMTIPDVSPSGVIIQAADTVIVPDRHGIDPTLLERVAASTVRVRGLDCRSAQFGTGFVVAPDLIATGAHVVAGIAAPIVVIHGTHMSTRVVAFDPVSDLALLRPTGDVELGDPLVLGEPRPGVVGAVLAYGDDDGPVVLPVLVERLIRATGADIYGQPAGGRDAIELLANIVSGHSGAPVVDADGLVVGILFSRLRGGGSVAYAVQSGELAVLIDGLARGEQAAGPCR
ncbi:MAG: trypsin-like peptidase domain-containing protein [Acidimicrobiales bacterium]|jgi:S1-C subfamily serine protease|nr:trypsin-like peptidase domain-containing protein [Acidimicrobiaceae bacterium]MBT5567913.1 trypsin-like peptidase domain-containing protein [Acidimicrobiaceae bacterium]MDG2160615.1 trypsin-like peptidase domain-containing protein [Acidimicrobiales bacterium]